MSGDGQPRKRKDKKKRKEDSVENIPLAAGINNNEDVTIHVHKDEGTGGNICAKIVFFLLFSVLIVLIGLIIKENQGLSDLDTVETDSRYSKISESWVESPKHEISEEHEEVDNYLESEGKESHEDAIDSEEHDEEHDDEDVDTEEDEDNEIEDEDENEEEDEEEENEEDDEEDVSAEDKNIDISEEESNKSEAELSKEDENEQEVDASEEADENSEEEQDDDKSKEDGVEEDEEGTRDEDEKEEDEDEEVEIKDSRIKKPTHQSKEVDEDSAKTADTANDFDEEGNLIDQTEIEVEVAEKEDVKDQEEKSGVAVKFEVGIALLIVAYVVLIRKWKSADSEVTQPSKPEETAPDLSRRNTIIPPPSIHEIEADMEQDEEDYSDDDEELSDDDVPDHYKSAKQKYQELQTTYNQSPEIHETVRTQMKPENPDFEVEEEEEKEELDEEEDVEEEEEELGDDGNEDDIEEDEIYDEDEDEELLKRLEAKYGKLGREVDIPLGEESGSEDEFANITNKQDNTAKQEVDKGH